MKVLKNYLYNASYQVFILLVPLITTPYLARVLGPRGVGVNSYTSSITQYFIILGSIGIDLYGNRQIAFVRDDKNKLTKTFFEIFLLRIITISVSCFVFAIFINSNNKYRIYFLAQSFSIIAAAFDISWFFMGMENFMITVLRNLIVKIITLGSIFLFVKSYKDLTVYILILSLSLLVGNLTLFPSLNKYLGNISIKDIHIWQHFLPSLSLFLPQVAIQIYTVLNKTVLGLLVSVQASGYFDQSDKIVRMALAVVTAMGTVMLPHVANAFSKGKFKKTVMYLYKGFSFVSVSAVPMAFGLVAVDSKFVPLFFTSKFLEVIPIMSIESIAIIFIAWGNAIGSQYLLPTKQVKAYTIAVVLGAIVNLVVIFPLIKLFGAVGASVATVVSEFTVSTYQLYSIRDQIDYEKIFKDLSKYLISGIIMFLVVKIIDILLPISWFMLIIEIIIGIVVYVLMLVTFKVKLVDDFKHILLNKFI
ncbi:oligosaccharide flippase family protein [Companilactobacillus nodensis]|uniref:Uncharacterized protein n=1 Tax=Companilactobacillus nodensis DSM 19682 = JCM 14932 = NBRC 107160 TaxID=1423775 RepID=A0A0R1K654_9LACO|nr:polysaccharide biosynthesis C-terminal domain-containing protein [Companilactobacillus nodensis]KRK79029.1 hypothetical protein FD03_GL001391 [Companilactobacillus nodensis DSM 19682 = JCM 14932 = NBRC 107160]